MTYKTNLMIELIKSRIHLFKSGEYIEDADFKLENSNGIIASGKAFSAVLPNQTGEVHVFTEGEKAGYVYLLEPYGKKKIVGHGDTKFDSFFKTFLYNVDITINEHNYKEMSFLPELYMLANELVISKSPIVALYKEKLFDLPKMDIYNFLHVHKATNNFIKELSEVENFKVKYLANSIVKSNLETHEKRKPTPWVEHDFDRLSAQVVSTEKNILHTDDGNWNEVSDNVSLGALSSITDNSLGFYKSLLHKKSSAVQIYALESANQETVNAIGIVENNNLMQIIPTSEVLGDASFNSNAVVINLVNVLEEKKYNLDAASTLKR